MNDSTNISREFRIFLSLSLMAVLRALSAS